MIGYGRVGSLIAAALAKRAKPFVVIEDQPDMARQAEQDGVKTVTANALDPRSLASAGIREASTVLIAIPEGFEAGAIFERARELNPLARVIARAHSDAEVEHLDKLGVDDVVMGEREIAARMIDIA